MKNINSLSKYNKTYLLENLINISNLSIIIKDKQAKTSCTSWYPEMTK